MEQAVVEGSPRPGRTPGILKGKIWLAPDFDETPQDVIDSFYESDSDDYLFGGRWTPTPTTEVIA